MGRSKNPEQTQEQILAVSIKLFTEKGYEQTSIQDILDALHLSKGGLYHHFKSKEEILHAVIQRRSRYAAEMLHHMILNTQAENSREKLIKILRMLGDDTETMSLDLILTSQKNNPYFVVGGLQGCISQDAPVICKLIEEGVRDGSLQTPQPAMCAEVFLLLLNFWANPALFGWDYQETRERLQYLQSILQLMGLDIIEDELIDSFLKRCQKTGTY